MAININRSRGLARRTGLTLLESLVAIAIIGILVSVTVVAVQRVRAAAARVECSHRLHNVALACHHFESVHHKLPEGVGYPFLQTARDTMSQAGLSWQTAILSFMDQAALWEMAWQAQKEDPINNETPLHHFVAGQTIPGFLCPTERYSFGWNPANRPALGRDILPGRCRDQPICGGRRIRHEFDGSHGGHHGRNLEHPSWLASAPAGPDGLYASWYAGWGNLAAGTNFMLDAGYGSWSPSEASCRYRNTMFRPGQLENICDVNHFWSLHSGGRISPSLTARCALFRTPVPMSCPPSPRAPAVKSSRSTERARWPRRCSRSMHLLDSLRQVSFDAQDAKKMTTAMSVLRLSPPVVYLKQLLPQESC